MAYGENADLAPNQQYGMDIGYVAIPGSDFVSLVLTVDKSVSPQVVPTALRLSATFTIKVNSQKYTVDDSHGDRHAAAKLAVPRTHVDHPPGHDTSHNSPDRDSGGSCPAGAFTGNCPAVGGACLTWDNTVLRAWPRTRRSQSPSPRGQLPDLPVGTLSQNRVKAVGTRTFGTPSQTQTFTTTDFVYVASGNTLHRGPSITKTSSATGPLYPGDTVYLYRNNDQPRICNN